MCVNKMAFETKADAQAWLKRSSNKGSKPRVYQCECEKFHFTRSTKADNRRWRKRKRLINTIEVGYEVHRGIKSI